MRFLKLNDRQDNDPNRWLDYKLFDSLKTKLRRLRVINRNNNFDYELTPDQMALGLTIKFTPDNRPYFPSDKKNRNLIRQLDSMGFFDVYCYNNAYAGGFGIYLSQVFMFLEYGIQWIRKGFKMGADVMEIHHICGNVLDNTIENLHIATKTLHCFLTNVQMGQHHSYSEYRQFKGPHKEVYSNDGSLVIGSQQKASKIAYLIKTTFERTQLWVMANMTYSVRKTIAITTQVNPADAFINQALGMINNVYEALDDSKDKTNMAIYANWIIPRSLPDLKTICEKIGGATKAFIKTILGKVEANEIFLALGV